MKKTIQYSTIWLALLCGYFLTACSEDALTPSDPQEFYTIPQGNASYDQTVVSLYDKYGTMFLYDFEERDFRWNITSFLPYYFNPGEKAYVAEALEFLEEACFGCWPENFLKKVMPHYFLLASRTYRVDRTYDWSVSEYVNTEVDLLTTYGFNHVDFGYTSSKLGALSASERRTLVGDVNKSLIAYACEAGMLEIPAGFLAISTPTNPGGDYPGSWGYNGAGFLEYRSGMTYGYDFGLFVKYLTSMSEADFKSWALSDSFDVSQEWDQSSSSYMRTYLIKQKYEIIIGYFQTELGIDLHAIGNAVAGV